MYHFDQLAYLRHHVVFVIEAQIGLQRKIFWNVSQNIVSLKKGISKQLSYQVLGCCRL